MATLLQIFMYEIDWLTKVLGLIIGTAILFCWSGRKERQLLYRIPGPRGWPLIGCISELLVPREKLFSAALETVQQHGSLVYCNAIGINSVMVCGPEGVQSLLCSRENLTKDSAYNFIKPWLGTGLVSSTGNMWRSHRRTLEPAFHFKILEDFIHVFNANSTLLIEELGKHKGRDYVEIDKYITLCTLDNICETAMGTSVNAQKGEGMDYVHAVERISVLFAERYLYPWLRPDFIFYRTSKGREMKQILETLQRFCTKVIQKKMMECEEKKSQKKQNNVASAKKKRLSILDMLLEFSDQGSGLTTKDVRDQVNTFIFAGHETTAATLKFAIYSLGCHEDIQDKVVRELDEIFGDDQRMPTMADFNRMTYLDKVIKEVLRMYPPVHTYARTLDTTLKIGQHQIPAGTKTVICAYLMHHDPGLYPEPEKFDPERFTPEILAKRHPYAYVPFSAGPRNCIGQKFARFEIMSVLSSVLRAFRLKAIEQVTVIPNIVLKSNKPFKIQLLPRV